MLTSTSKNQAPAKSFEKPGVQLDKIGTMSSSSVMLRLTIHWQSSEAVRKTRSRHGDISQSTV